MDETAHRTVPLRTLFAAVALSLLSGTVAGYAAGRAGDDGGSADVTAAGTGDEDTAVADRTAEGDAGSGGVSGSIGVAPDQMPPLTRVFLRTGAGGIGVRAYRMDFGGQVPCAVDGGGGGGAGIEPAGGATEPAVEEESVEEEPVGDEPVVDTPAQAPPPPDGGVTEPWCPPVECQPTGELQIGLSNDEAVGMGGAAEYATAPTGVAGTGSFGDAEASPGWWAAVRTGADVALVRVAFDGGGRDEMAPVDGWAVLVSPAPARFAAVAGTFEALDAGGAVVAGGDLTVKDPVATDECQPPPPPPPPLPEPTGPPPADEPAARAAVEEAFVRAFDGDLPKEDRRAVIERADEISDVMDEARKAWPAETVASETKVDEIRFLDADEAAVRFTIDLGDRAPWGPTVGRALLIDGRWLVAQATACELLSFSGYPCKP